MMLYSEKYRVRWHDTDARREMRPSAVLEYMQECANHQFLTHAKSLDRMRDEDGVGFILSRIAVDLLAPVYAYEEIEVRTATVQGHGLCFPRRFEILRDGKPVARATSQWAMVRVSDRKLLRAEEAPLSFGDEPEIETTAPLRFRVPREHVFEQVGERRIAYADLDYNMHMNNTKYPDTVCDFLPDPLGSRVTGMSLAYHREAAYGDLLAVERAADGEGNFYIRTKKDGATCLEAFVSTEPR
jgi:medium-chain acyl-[acyl-carrier-protein] hydrolase